MKNVPLLLSLALLCGCTGTQVKNTALGVSGALVRGAVASRGLDRAVERCKANQNAATPDCNRERIRAQRRANETARQQERAREARRAQREQEEYFERTFDAAPEQNCAPDAVECEPVALSVTEQHQRHNALLDSLSDDLSKTLSDESDQAL